MKKINLEEILNKHSDVKDSYPTFGIIDAMKDACKQALELAAENARISHFYYDKWEDSKLYEKYKDSGFQRCDGDGIPYGVDIEFINKDSILNTINQIE